MVLHAHDQYAAARDCYRRARGLDSKAFAWPYYLSYVETALGNHDAALSAIDRAITLDPDHQPARLKRAEVLLDKGRIEESGRAYASLLSNHPDSAAAWYGQGRVQVTRGDNAAAVESLSRACALFPQYGSARYLLAQTLRKLRRETEAQQHLTVYEKYQTVVPATGDAVLQEVLRLNISAANFIRQGADLEAAGRIPEAIEAHRKALEVDPKSAQAHINLISLYARAAQPEKAAEAYRAAVALAPGQAEVHYNYGVLEFGRKRYASARKAFEAALAANPRHAEAHNNLAYLLEMQEQHAAAFAHYQQAVENAPGHRLAHFHLGRILTGRRQYKEAISHFEKTLAPEDENTPGYLYALGAAHGRAGHRDQARQILLRARTMALARSQSGLAASIEKDLRLIESLR